MRVKHLFKNGLAMSLTNNRRFISHPQETAAALIGTVLRESLTGANKGMMFNDL